MLPGVHVSATGYSRPRQRQRRFVAFVQRPRAIHSPENNSAKSPGTHFGIAVEGLMSTPAQAGFRTRPRRSESSCATSGAISILIVLSDSGVIGTGGSEGDLISAVNLTFGGCVLLTSMCQFTASAPSSRSNKAIFASLLRSPVITYLLAALSTCSMFRAWSNRFPAATDSDDTSFRGPPRTCAQLLRRLPPRSVRAPPRRG
jgi:hypothetical protein